MDNYRLILCKDNNPDIISHAEKITWKDDVDTLGMELVVDKLYSDEKYFPKIKVSTGDKVILYNNAAEIFRGIVTDEGFGSRFGREYTAYDYAFYLNKSDVVIQFNKTRADTAIKQLCQRFDVPVGNITAITTTIKKIYTDQTVSDVIKDILDTATKELGIKYRLEMRSGKLFIEKYTDLIVKAFYKPASNLAAFDVTKMMTLSGGSRSIADMKNSIIIAAGNDSKAIKATMQDENSIKKYGLLQAVEIMEKANAAQARNTAKNMLKDLNRVKESFSLELMGADNVRAGRIMSIEDKVNEINGNYLVKSCSHHLQNGHHTMICEMENYI